MQLDVDDYREIKWAVCWGVILAVLLLALCGGTLTALALHFSNNR